MMGEKDSESKTWQDTVMDLLFMAMRFGMKDWDISDSKEVEEE